MSATYIHSDMECYLGPKGYSIQKSSISIDEQHEIKKDLMVKPFAPPNSIQQPKVFPIYRESPKKLYVPRFYGVKKYGIPEDIRIPEGDDIDIEFKGGMRDYQVNIVNTYLKAAEKHGCGLLEIPCGRGKCLGVDTPVMMADGSIKKVQYITNGDMVMGDDYTPRVVYGINTGYSRLYKVKQDKGMDYVVNDCHILTLYNSHTNQLEDINIDDFLKLNPFKQEPYYGVRKTRGAYIYTRIEIEDVPRGFYYGFMIGGNHRFLLGDATITHNTVMALNIISQLKKKALVIVHKEFLMNQWIERIEQFLPDARVGRIQGPTVDIEDKDIVIGMLQSLSMKEYPAGTFDSFGLTISDECFPAGSKVLTTNGLKNIEELNQCVNKLDVLCYNHTTQEYETKRITNWFERKPKPCVNIYYTTGNNIVREEQPSFITCSLDHRIYIVNRNEYLYANEILPGDKFLGPYNKEYVVCYRHLIGEQGILYDIEVENNHNFFVCNNDIENPVLVHNCHHISAEVFCRSLFKIVTKYMLGLSATMNRKDGLTHVFKQFLGDVVYREVRETDDDVLVKTIQYKSDDPDFSETLYNFKGQTHYALMIRKLCEFNQRSELILKVLKDLIDEDDKRQVMILAHNKSLLKYLHDAVEHREIASVGYYVGGMKEAALKETESKRVVIATYAMAEEALDIKTLSALILATPKTDVTQAVGRILRMKHDNPVVVDIVDQHDVFQKQYIKRRRFYMKCKYKIIQTNNRDYGKGNSIWKTIYEPGEKAETYKKKIVKTDKAKKGQGKCLLDFAQFKHMKLQNLI